MAQSLNRTWWLLAFCGVLDAIVSAMLFFLRNPSRPSILAHGRDTVTQIGILALTAGACTIAAGLSTAGVRSTWLLVMNGGACGSLGLLLAYGGSRPVAFRTIALLIVVMAVSIGIYELATARMFRGHWAEQYFLGAAGVVSVGFAGAFLAFVLHAIRLDPTLPAQGFNWLGAYFAFSAISMVGLSLPLSGSAAPGSDFGVGLRQQLRR